MTTVEVFEIDDDFDPLEGFDEAAEEDETRPDTDYQLPVIPDADKSVVPEVAPATPQERIEQLLKGIPGQTPRILHAVELSREGCAFDELVARLDADCPNETSVYDAGQIVRLLEHAGALNVSEEAPDGEGAARDASPATEPCAGEGAEVAEKGAPAVDAADVADVEGVAGVAEAAETAEGTEAAAQPCYLTVTPAPKRVYTATPEGIAALDAFQDENAAYAILMQEPQYLPIYREILEMTSTEGGAVTKALDAAIDVNPLCAEPRRFCGYFLGKLEMLDAVAFRATWVATERGARLLASDIFAN